MEHYDILETIGQGAYGEVFKARHKRTKKFFAVKRIPIRKDNEGVPSTSTREISVLREMNHENIVRLHEVIPSRTKQSLYLVFEYLDLDLMKHMNDPEFSKDPHLVKKFLYHILRGIDYCHSHGVLHRDLKPQNLLIDLQNSTLKLADFGLARTFVVPVDTYTHEVVTLWYRPPEILLGSRKYSTPVDVWSIGCIFAEMATRKTLFCGSTEIEQLSKIFEIMGAPNEDTWPGVRSLPKFKSSFLQLQAKEDLIATMVPNLDSLGLDLLRKMLCLDPSRRITAKAALQHDYFKDIKIE